MKKKGYSLYLKVLSFLLGLLGFASCDDPVDEYGVPSAKYKIKGTIVDNTKEAKPIQNIKVKFVETVGDRENNYTADSIQTDSNGNFDLTIETFPKSDFKLKISDIDGAENGEFENRELDISYKDAEFVGGSNWNRGEATMDMKKIELTTKKKN